MLSSILKIALAVGDLCLDKTVGRPSSLIDEANPCALPLGSLVKATDPFGSRAVTIELNDELAGG